MGLMQNRVVVVTNASRGAGKAFECAETTEFTGLVIDGLAKDPKRMERSGKVWVGAELAKEYGIQDIDGKQPPSDRRAFGDETTFSDAVVD